MATITAYTDESGNTGLDVFDAQQQWFWTGTLLVQSNLESEANGLKIMLEKCGLDEVHAQKIGFKGLEPIAPYLAQLLRLHDCRFVFTRINKLHFAATKLVDTILDSGNNQAVSPVHYIHRGFRLRMAFELLRCMTNEIVERFWPAFLENRAAQFSAAMADLRKEMDAELHDPRGRQLLGDAVSWAMENPSAVLDCARSELESPNVLAFCMLTQAIQDLITGTEITVSRFVHDRQNQFGRAIMDMYGIVSRIRWKSAIQAVFGDWVWSDKFKCTCEMSPDPLVGLQLVDAVLWLVKREFDNGSVHGACGELVDYGLEHGLFREFSPEQFLRDTESAVRAMFAEPLPPELEERARASVKENEAQRLARMKTKASEPA